MLAVLAVLVAGLDLGVIILPGHFLPFGQQMVASIVAPLVVALVALAYVLTTRPGPRSPAGDSAGAARTVA